MSDSTTTVRFVDTSITVTLDEAMTLVLANQRGLSVAPETLRMADEMIRSAGRQIADRWERKR